MESLRDSKAYALVLEHLALISMDERDISCIVVHPPSGSFPSYACISGQESITQSVRSYPHVNFGPALNRRLLHRNRLSYGVEITYTKCT